MTKTDFPPELNQALEKLRSAWAEYKQSKTYENARKIQRAEESFQQIKQRFIHEASI